MDNLTLARLLDETAALLEIDGADPFRIRSYRRAAEAVEQQTAQLAPLTAPDADPKALLAISGIGKGMAANIRDLVTTGTMPLRDELMAKYRPTMLELLRLPGMGPKTVALVWSSLQVSTVDELEAAAKAGHLNKLPRMGAKFVEKLLKGIEDHRRNSSRFRIDKARKIADTLAQLILAFPGIETVTPAGSLRRGRETVGDLDLLATGPGLRARRRRRRGRARRHAAAHRQADGARAEQGHLHPALKPPGRRPPAAAQELRGGPAILSPAPSTTTLRCASAPSSRASHSASTRSCASKTTSS